MKTVPAGTLADILAKVNINKVANGVFSSHLLAGKFIKLGIEDILDKLNKNILFADDGRRG